MMHRVAFKILKNDEDARDIVQETLLKMYKNRTAPDVNDESAAKILSVAVKNMAINLYGKLAKSQTISYEDELKSDITDSCNYVADDKIALLQCIGRLPSLYREYIELRYHQDMSVKEIAKMKGKSEKSVYVILKKASAKLKVMMNE